MVSIRLMRSRKCCLVAQTKVHFFTFVLMGVHLENCGRVGFTRSVVLEDGHSSHLDISQTTTGRSKGATHSTAEIQFIRSSHGFYFLTFVFCDGAEVFTVDEIASRFHSDATGHCVITQLFPNDAKRCRLLNFWQKPGRHHKRFSYEAGPMVFRRQENPRDGGPGVPILFCCFSVLWCKIGFGGWSGKQNRIGVCSIHFGFFRPRQILSIWQVQNVFRHATCWKGSNPRNYRSPCIKITGLLMKKFVKL